MKFTGPSVGIQLFNAVTQEYIFLDDKMPGDPAIQSALGDALNEGQE